MKRVIWIEKLVVYSKLVLEEYHDFGVQGYHDIETLLPMKGLYTC